MKPYPSIQAENSRFVGSLDGWRSSVRAHIKYIKLTNNKKRSFLKEQAPLKHQLKKARRKLIEIRVKKAGLSRPTFLRLEKPIGQYISFFDPGD
ncbi:MAG: hypothetical protein ACI9FD_003310 [Gammaproteobacteria bacterium]|jgi:hypothetical protein